MAGLPDHAIPDRQYVRQAFLSPLSTVKDFFEALEELRSAARNSATDSKRMLGVCERVTECGEQLALCLEQQVQLRNRASETAQEVSGAFRLGLHRLVRLRGECGELRNFVKQLQLAEQGLDARPLEYSLSSQLQQKQQGQKDFVVPGGSPLPRAASYDDFRKHRDLHLSSKKSVDSSSNIRRTKSESEVTMQSLKKKMEGLTIDNTRLRTSEKKILKDSIKLNRKCKNLEEERDRAEDRLKIEQTQRDSIEKLRQRNKELEEQLRKLCETQVIRERDEATQKQTQEQEPEHDDVPT